jgi:hypothetical protein
VFPAIARAQGQPAGPPPNITPEHEAQVRAELEQQAVAAQSQDIYAQSAREVDRERYEAWIARGAEKKPTGFRLGDFVLGGANIAGVFSVYGGGRNALSIGSRAQGHVTLWRWLSLEGRAAIASEVFEGLHFPTTSGVLSMRAEGVINERGTVFATLGAGAEAPFGGGARTPDASLLVPLSLGVELCVVALGDGCGGVVIESTFGLRVPFGGAEEMRIPRGFLAFNLGPTVLF